MTLPDELVDLRGSGDIYASALTAYGVAFGLETGEIIRTQPVAIANPEELVTKMKTDLQSRIDEVRNEAA